MCIWYPTERAKKEVPIEVLKRALVVAEKAETRIFAIPDMHDVLPTTCESNQMNITFKKYIFEKCRGHILEFIGNKE